jgi:hypothetical protein
MTAIAQQPDGRLSELREDVSLHRSGLHGWRQFHLSHLKGEEGSLEAHGYCGYAGRPERD